MWEKMELLMKNKDTELKKITLLEVTNQRLFYSKEAQRDAIYVLYPVRKEFSHAVLDTY